ncbi:MAG: thioredoxin family protein [Planctomycetes bacterium]|nr:thioredoxin family protein [Planctomycetota bacterium]
MNAILPFALCLLAPTLIVASAQSSARDDAQAAELGRVQFGRDVDRALTLAREQKKPVFLLFQEIPGCGTCQAFGAGPLSNPLLVEAIETLFVPVVVHNNKGGADKVQLERFKEPSWNNPVVRYLDADGHDLIAREEGVWSSGAVAARMIAALEKARAAVPTWLRLAGQELDTSTHERAVFSMHCFWEGQVALGGIDGVVDARPGFIDGAEVVDVRFVPTVISLPALLRRAEALSCASQVWLPSRERVDEARAVIGDRAHYLAGMVRTAADTDDLRRLHAARAIDQVKLTRAQQLRVNALLAAPGGKPDAVLSPRQIVELRAIEKRLAQ